MNKKILFINSSLTGGGSERVMTLIANQFAKEQNNVTMVLLRDKKKDTYKLNNNINCIRFKYASKNKIIIAIQRIYKLRKAIKNGKYDYVISFMNDINITTLLAGWNLHTPIIISERADPSVRKTNKLYKTLEHFIMTKAEKIVFQTEQVKKMYPNKIQKKSVVIPNPVNKNLPEPYHGKKDKKIVAIGRLSNQKNFPMLINSFAEFHKENNDYVLEIYGEGSLLSELKDLVKKHELEKHIFFKGYIEDIPTAIKKAEMYISTSNYEGISNAMIEALAMGIPSICTNCPVGGASMMIKNNINGILIPVKDEKALVESMNKISKDLEFANKLSNNGCLVREEYSIEKIAKKWQKIIK